VLLRRAEEPADTARLLALSARLERFSPSARVDILVLGAQGAILRHRILKEGLLVKDTDPQARMQFEERTIRDYLDWNRRTTSPCAARSPAYVTALPNGASDDPRASPGQAGVAWRHHCPAACDSPGGSSLSY
jgi:hypothetical protein